MLKKLVATVAVGGALLMAVACGETAPNVAPPIQVEVTREVPVTRQVEVTREVPVTITRMVKVTREVERQIPVDVTREVPVTRKVEVTREVPVTRQVYVTREVPVTRQVEVTREVPVTRQVEVTREVPVTRQIEVTRIIRSTIAAVIPTPTPSGAQSVPVPWLVRWLIPPVVDANNMLSFEVHVPSGSFYVPDPDEYGRQGANVSIYHRATPGNDDTRHPIFSIFPKGFESITGDDSVINAETYQWDSESRKLRVSAKVPAWVVGIDICIWSGTWRSKTTGVGIASNLLGCSRIESE